MLTPDQIRVMVSFAISIPLSIPIRHIPIRSLRYIYAFLMGTIIQFYIYGTELWLPFLQHFIVFALIKLRGRNCGPLIIIYSILSLFIYHIYRMIIDYGGWSFDASTLLMTAAIRYSLLAYSFEDGQYEDQLLNKDQRMGKIKKFPGLLDYLCYCQFGPAAVIGTPFQYNIYKKFMELQKPFDTVVINWKQVLKTIVFSVIYFLIYGVGTIYAPLSYMKESSFAQQSFWYILLYSFVCVQLQKFKYYFGWTLGTSSLHACGITYNIQTKKYDLIKNVQVWICQFSSSTRVRIGSWNITTQQWLRKCIYERLRFKDKSNNQLVTFLVSAFWHGSYGGYYISFVLWFMHLHIASLFYKLMQKQNFWFVKIYKKGSYITEGFASILSIFLFNHTATYFMVLSLKTSFFIMKQIYFCPIIIYVGGIAFFTMLSIMAKSFKSKQKKHEKKEQVKAVAVKTNEENENTKKND